MGIDEEGYLSKDIANIEKDILSHNRDYFDLAQKINGLGHSLKFKLNIHRQNAQEITSATLFVSLLESFNSLYILLSKGLINDSNILLRSMIEKTLRLKYVSLSYQNVIDYHKAYEKQRLKMMNVILADKEGTFSEEVKRAISEKEREVLAQKIKSENIKDLPSNEDLAKMTGLMKIYGNAYRLLTDHVHTNAILINKFLKSDQDGVITDLQWFSYFTDTSPEIKKTMYSAQYLVLIGIETIMELFKIEDEMFEDLATELKNLGVSFTSNLNE